MIIVPNVGAKTTWDNLASVIHIIVVMTRVKWALIYLQFTSVVTALLSPLSHQIVETSTIPAHCSMMPALNVGAKTDLANLAKVIVIISVLQTQK